MTTPKDNTNEITPQGVESLLNGVSSYKFPHVDCNQNEGFIIERDQPLSEAAPAIARAYLEKCTEFERFKATTNDLVPALYDSITWQKVHIERLQAIIDKQREALDKMSMAAFKIRDSRSDHQDWSDHEEYADGFEDACESINDTLTKIYNDCLFPEETLALTKGDVPNDRT